MLTVGDLIVGVGTIALALGTWRLARITARIDRNASGRETRREASATRGVAQLVDAQLDFASQAIGLSLEERNWRSERRLPRDAWDRHGAQLVQALTSDDANALISVYVQVAVWDTVTADAQKLHPDKDVTIALGDKEIESLSDLRQEIERVELIVRSVAYPAAKPLPVGLGERFKAFRDPRG